MIKNLDLESINILISMTYNHQYEKVQKRSGFSR